MFTITWKDIIDCRVGIVMQNPEELLEFEKSFFKFCHNYGFDYDYVKCYKLMQLHYSLKYGIDEYFAHWPIRIKASIEGSFPSDNKEFPIICLVAEYKYLDDYYTPNIIYYKDIDKIIWETEFTIKNNEQDIVKDQWEEIINAIN